MKVKHARMLRDALMIIGVLVMLLSALYEPLLMIGGIIACSCLIPHFLFNRCPHCGRQLGNHNGDHCQFCGMKIEN